MLDSAATRGVINLARTPRILLVDDVPDNLKLLGSLFDSNGLELSFAKNGIRAQKLAEMSDFELAVLDINLPDIDGFSLAERIREHQPHCEIIFCSAHSERENRERGSLLGAIDFIEKPYDLDITRSRVKLHMERILLRHRIAQERDRNEAILANIRDAVITVNATEMVVDWNQGASDLFSISEAEMTGKPMSVLFPDDARHRSFTEMLASITPDERGVVRVVNEMRTWQGEPFMAELSLSGPFEASEPLITSTVRKIAESITLKQRASLYREVLDGQRMAYLMLTHEGVILEQSDAFSSLSEELGLWCGEVGSTLESCFVSEAFQRVLAGEREFSCQRPCDASELVLRVYEDQSHRAAYLITFSQKRES